MKPISLITIILVILSCNAQNKQKQTTQTHTEMTTETFDIKTFNKNKINDEYNFVLDDGTKIRKYSSKDNFTEIISPPEPNLFKTQKQYFKNGKLHLKFVSFERDFIKSKKEYDETGKLIEEINYDTPYKFTFEQLLELLKKEKDSIGIFDKNTVITRGVLEIGAIWEVEWKKTFGRRETLKIDGITGEVLERSFYPMKDN